MLLMFLLSLLVAGCDSSDTLPGTGRFELPPNRFFTHVIEHGHAINGCAKMGRARCQKPNGDIFAYAPEPGELDHE